MSYDVPQSCAAIVISSCFDHVLMENLLNALTVLNLVWANFYC